MKNSLHKENLLRHLFRHDAEDETRDVYAIVDAAQDEAIYPLIRDASPEHLCLFFGRKAVEMAEVAPYLVRLDPNDPFTDQILEKGWGNSWGIFLQSPSALQELARHFRRYLMVYDEDGKPLYFRFYDPRVFRVYLPTCNEAELKTVFGPVSFFLLEDEARSTALRFHFVSGGLQHEKLHLCVA